MLLIKEWKVTKPGRADGYYSVGDCVSYTIENICDVVDDLREKDEVELLMTYKGYQIFGPKGKTHPEGYRTWHSQELYPHKADLESSLDEFIDKQRVL